MCYNRAMSTEMKNSDTVADVAAVAYSVAPRNWGAAGFDELLSSLRSRGFGKSAARLVDLRFADDLEEGDEPLSLESARGFVNLMRGFQRLGEPRIGIFPRGTLAVEWRIADDKHLLVQPLDGERATFAFIGPASGESGGRYRLNGRGSIAKVIDTLQREGVEQWAG